ncbi:MAG: FAD-binding oxidoreductase [Burkholderiales bacterium]|nr:FAD-binding oxidoreductase [Burkholderiales bacterium]
MTETPTNLSRRRCLEALAVSGLSTLVPLPSLGAQGNRVINDISRLNPVVIAEERLPRSTDEVRAALRAWAGAVSIGGGRFSMGGQIAAPHSLHVDMRGMNQVVNFDAARRLIRVQAGMTWRDIQDVIDPHDLSIRTMQSYSNFTVGGSLSVNCHGRYVGRGPLINSVSALQLVTAGGDVLELSRTRDAELFRAVFGGYGGLGVVIEVELQLDSNTLIERVVHDVSLEQYPAFYREQVLPDARMVLHNAYLAPPGFDRPRPVSWLVSEKPATERQRLVPRGLDYSREQNFFWAMTELPAAGLLRDMAERRLLGGKDLVVWRNHEASKDTASLEPRTRRISTYLLQEYFIPVRNFFPFLREMARILNAHSVNALNVSIRHSPADTLSLMTWAPTEVFSFVLFYKQRTLRRASAAVRAWTRELIDAALANEGRYFLPYRLDATRAQFERAYPEAREFAVLKARIDPGNRLKNLLWNNYL